MQKRVLSFLMVLAMVFSLLPVGVTATGTEDATPTSETPAFTFTFERANPHAAVTAGGTVDVNVYLTYNGTDASEYVNGFQLIFGTNVTVNEMTLVDQPNAEEEDKIAPAISVDKKTVYWLDTHDAETQVAEPSYSYCLTAEPKHVATVTLNVAAVDSTMTLATLLGAEGKVGVYYDVDYTTEAEEVYTEASCNHNGETVACGHSSLATTWTDLETALANTAFDATNTSYKYLAAGNYYVSESFTLDCRIGVTNDIVICLNNQTITPKSGNRPFEVMSDGKTLTICDCTAHTDSTGAYVAGVIKCSTGTFGGALRASKGTLTVTNGIVDGSGVSFNADCEGTAVYTIVGATFNMYGGEIRNIAKGRSVFESRGTTNLKNVTIKNCTIKEAVLSGLYSSATDTMVYNIEDTIISNCGQYAATISKYTKSFTVSGNCQFECPVVICKGEKLIVGALEDTAHIEVFTAADQAVVNTYTSYDIEGDEPTTIGNWLTAAADVNVPADTLFYANNGLDWPISYSDSTFSVNPEPDPVAHEIGEKSVLCYSLTQAVVDANGGCLPGSGSWYLSENVTVTNTATVAKGATLNLCLNGKTVTLKADSATDRVFIINGTANIDDCQEVCGGFTQHADSVACTEGGIFANLCDQTSSPRPVLNLYNGKIYGFTTGGKGTVYMEANRTGSEGAYKYNYGGVFNMYGGEISGNTTSNGGAVAINTRGNGGASKISQFNMYGGKLCGNTATVTGSAIQVDGGDLGTLAKCAVNIYGGEISNNTSRSTTHPGMISLVISGYLNIKGEEAPVVLTSEGSEPAIMVLNSVQCYVENAVLTNESGNTIYAPSAADYGSTAGSKTPVVKLTNTTVNGNIDLYEKAKLTLTDVTVNSGDIKMELANSSLTLSGMVTADDSSLITLAQGQSLTVNELSQASAFTFTVAGVGEDGVTVAEDPATVNNVAIIAAADGTTVTEWPCQTVKFRYGETTTPVAYSPNSENVKRFWLNAAHIHTDGTVYEVWPATGLPTTANNYYLTADVTLTAKQDTAEDGKAGAWNPVGASKLCLNSYDLTVSGATAENPITVIHVGGEDSSLVIDDCTASGSGETYTAGQISGGWGVFGGGIRVDEGASLTLNGGIITGNTAKGDSTDGKEDTAEDIFAGGAGIYLENGSFTMNGGSVSGNLSYGVGGAVYSRETSMLKVKGGLVDNNEAKAHGGAIYAVNSSDVDLTGGVISNNKATNNGGAIHMENASFMEISGTVELIGNSASYGGAVSAYGGNTLVMTGGTISGNTAQSGGGIDIGASSSTGKIEITGGTISGNTATATNKLGNGCGGGIYIHGVKAKTVTIDGANVVIKGNNAYLGGGIYLKEHAKLTVKNVTIGGTGTAEDLTEPNTAYRGGGVYLNAPVNKVVFEDVDVSRNRVQHYEYTNADGEEVKAENSMGAAFNVTGGSLELDNCTIHNNYADYQTPAMNCTGGAEIVITGGSIQDNVASNAVGAINLQGNNTELTLDGVQITNNTGASHGAMNIAKNSSVSLTLKGATKIYGNFNGKNERNLHFQEYYDSITFVGDTAATNIYRPTLANCLNVSGLTEGAKVGISWESNKTNTASWVGCGWMHFTADLDENSTVKPEYLFSDKTGYGVVELTRKADITSYKRGGSSTNGFTYTAWDVENNVAATAKTYETEETTRLYLCAAVYNNDPYKTPAAAVEASDGTAAKGFVKLYTAGGELTGNADQDLYLDLNGNDATVSLTEGKTLYAIDSSTDDYESGNSTDGYTYGVLTTDSTLGGYEDSVWGNAKDGKRYVQLSEGTAGNQYSFHRVYLSIYSTLYRTHKNGVGFKARFAADEAVAALINAENGSYGIKLNVDGNLNEPGADVAALDEYTFTAGLPNSTPNKLLIAITEILSTTEPLTTGDDIKTRAETGIVGVPYISLNGGAIRIEGNSTSGTEVSLKSMVKAAAVAEVTGDAYTNIQTMINAYSSYFTAANGYDVTWFTQTQS